MQRRKKSTGRTTINYSTVDGKAIKLTNMSSKAAKAKFLGSFDIVMSDFDGILWNFDKPVPGAAEGLILLKNAGKQYKLVTNNNSRNDEEYVDLMKSMGIKDLKHVDIEYPVKTIARYLRKYKFGQSVFSLCSKSFNDVLVGAGVQVFSMNPCVDLSVQNIGTKLRQTNKVAAVIYDRNVNLTYAQLALAQQYLLNDECCLIVGGIDTFAPLAPNVQTIGNAGFINMLRETSGKEPIIMGRPGPILGPDLREKYEITKPERVLFIGNSLLNDVQFGISCGYKTLLISTNPMQSDELAGMSDNMKPDFLARSMGDFVPLLATETAAQ